MITAQELRLGNVLIVAGIEKIVYVAAIFKTHFRCQDKDGISFEESLRVNYNPIPLSEEILLKCGFVEKRSDGGNYIEFVKGQYQFHFRIKYDCANCFGIIGSANSVSYFNWNTIHLHDLQNIVHALTGQELNTSGL